MQGFVLQNTDSKWPLKYTTARLQNVHHADDHPRFQRMRCLHLHRTATVSRRVLGGKCRSLSNGLPRVLVQQKGPLTTPRAQPSREDEEEPGTQCGCVDQGQSGRAGAKGGRRDSFASLLSIAPVTAPARGTLRSSGITSK